MVTIDQLLAMDVVSDANIAPGGASVVYTISPNGSAKGERALETRVWLRMLDEAESSQLTFGPNTDNDPRWAPDAAAISFLSDREQKGKSQIYLLDGSFREARKLTDSPGGVAEHIWSPNGDVIAFSASDFVSEHANDVKLYDADRRYRRLYLYDVKSGTSKPVNHRDLHVWEFCWSPDGSRIAAIVSDEPFEWGWYDAKLVLIDAHSGEVESLNKPERQIARPAWSPDGSRIALITCRWSDPGMTGGDVITVRVSDGQVNSLTAGEPRSHFTVHWSSDSSRLVTVGLEQAHAQVCDVDPTSGSSPRWTDAKAITDYGGSYDPVSDIIALTLSDPSTPPDVWTVTTSAARITASNSDDSHSNLAWNWMEWESTDGRTIHGLYYPPAEPDGDSPAPLVTLVHGGPTAAASAAFPLGGPSAWIPLLVKSGVGVFVPNFRGSNGYGVEFAEANLGDLGGMDLQDVLSGVDSLVLDGKADPARLGIGGWSYGGYLTAWAITQTNRFAAAVAGAPITNWYSFHGGSNIPGFDAQFLGTDPDELDGPYAWTSPIFFSKHVSTPTLFIHGEQDPCCPPGQSFEMVRALKRRGVTAECAVYPREGHGFIEKEHRRDMVERSFGWFKKYLDMT
jgi:dipeptidyl aminopeptidase/acylaminoacyl peptidase